LINDHVYRTGWPRSGWWGKVGMVAAALRRRHDFTRGFHHMVRTRWRCRWCALGLRRAQVADSSREVL